MSDIISFSNFKFGEKLTKFSPGVMEYLPFSKLLDLSRLLDLDMIPAGLRGVKTIQIRHRFKNDFPRFIAPDFKGEIIYKNSNEVWEKMPDDLVFEAKKNYARYRKQVEAPRYPMRGLYNLCVLPTKMHFFRKGINGCLDLSQTTITEKPFILGAFHVIMPSQKITHHRGRQMVHSKPKIYER